MIGVDEVGRGCLAGPLLVVAARKTGTLPKGLKDSKLLSRSKREAIYPLLITNFQFGEGWVTSSEIDRYGLADALRLGVKRALKNLKAGPADHIVMDGKVNYMSKKYINAECVIDADNTIPIVSAASVYAKVTRDKYMAGLAERFPDYGFENHAGYGTARHVAAINSHGFIKSVHRTTFRPIAGLQSGT